MSKNSMGALAMVGILVLMGVVSFVSWVMPISIPEDVVAASMGVRPMPLSPEYRNEPECFGTDAAQQLPFQMCYIPGQGYDQTSLRFVFPSDAPKIDAVTFVDVTRNKFIELLGHRGIDVATPLTLREFWSSANIPKNQELIFALTLKSAAGAQGRVEGTLKLAAPPLGKADPSSSRAPKRISK